jgi:hypothetical protein
MNLSLFVSALLLAGVSLAFLGCKTSRSGYESAPYSVVLSNGDYELRDVFISQAPRTMAFVLPAKSSAEQAPAPLDSSLSLKKIPAGRFAVLRFSGARSAAKESQSIALLKTWIAEKGLVALESPVFGYFDPPWTPSFLRRNEVMLRLMPKQ